jgi:hypothetical protein
MEEGRLRESLANRNQSERPPGPDAEVFLQQIAVMNARIQVFESERRDFYDEQLLPPDYATVNGDETLNNRRRRDNRDLTVPVGAGPSCIGVHLLFSLYTQVHCIGEGGFNIIV